MDRKIIMGVAAVAGIGLLLYMRKSGDQATLAGSGSLVGAATSAAGWASQPIVINANTKPLAAADQTATSPAPKPPAPPAPAPANVAVWGGGSGAQVTGVDNGSSYGKAGPNGTWIWPDGTKTSSGVTSSQAMSVMGY